MPPFVPRLEPEPDELEGVTWKGFLLGFAAGIMVTLACVGAGVSHVMHAEQDSRCDPQGAFK